ncbi:MAG: pantetheine-phosphate adenylyltransferase [Syntrophomonadaceae bacterium]|nr:pantetheine-phosphate adenylyltransferase [Syntrophomonadaceae bacterium]
MIGLYPGSFDPITNGHLNIIERSTKIVSKLIIGVLDNCDKKSFFPLADRVAMIRESTKHLKNISIITFDGLLVDCAKINKADIIIRGLRNLSDLHFETQLDVINKKLDNTIEIIYLISCDKYLHLSSSIVKEIALKKGDISKFVPEAVVERFRRRDIFKKTSSIFNT